MKANVFLPYVGAYNDEVYLEFLRQNFAHVQFLSQEKRLNFNGEFPRHNRYFSNGDKPLVGLVNTLGFVQLHYENQLYDIPVGHYVFFDDNIKHSWVMKDANLIILYYKQNAADVVAPVCEGDYCIDSLF